MKTVAFADLRSINFAITDISVIYQNPTWNCLGDANGSGRILNGFILVDKGSCRYEWKGKSADLYHGGLIYLATGSTRVVTVTERPFSFYRICFKIYDVSDGRQIIFDENPWVVNTESAQILFELCSQMCKSSISNSHFYKTTSLLYEFLHTVNKEVLSNYAGKITPAIDYIERHYMEDVNISTLAARCFMSKPHFFRLFKSAAGMTPLEYRNNIRIERAKILLSDGECGVADIAEILGFENAYYFSRLFKKIVGVPPSKYIPAERKRT